VPEKKKYNLKLYPACSFVSAVNKTIKTPYKKNNRSEYIKIKHLNQKMQSCLILNCTNHAQILIFAFKSQNKCIARLNIYFA
jgi:hypothetical protein